MLKLQVFEKAYALSIDIHRRSLEFPDFEQRELACQLRRASKSICANLIEGFGKNASAKEKRRYVVIAVGSCDETKLWLNYPKDLHYLDKRMYRHFKSGFEEVGKMLYGLRISLEAEINKS